MDEQTRQRQQSVDQKNHSVKLLENLKTFLARLFSDLIRNLKIITWSVRVENQVNIPEAIDTRDELRMILTAIRQMPEQKETDLTPVCNMLQMMLDKPEKEMPKEYNDEMLIEAVKCVEKAIQSLPEVKETDMSALEDKLSKLIELMTPKPIINKPIKEVKAPKFIGEEIVKNAKGEIIEVVQKWEDKDIAKVKEIYTENGLIKTLWREEVRVK